MNAAQCSIWLYFAAEEDTHAFAELFSHALTGYVATNGTLAVFLTGSLGSGKTTFTRYVVRALPGGMHAEVSSPSFTICNIYPTRPPVWHCDLYRLGPDISDENIETALDEPQALVFIEWGQWLKRDLVPVDHVEMNWHGNAQAREVEVVLYGRTVELELFLKEYGSARPQNSL